jgi:drug/metabolite transporter (DMT)-like permease
MVYLAEARLPSGLVAVIFTLLMVFNMIGARLIFGQHISRRAGVGAAAGVIGIILVFWPEVTRFDVRGEAWHGLLFAVAGTLFSCCGNLLSVQTQKRGIAVIPTITIGMGAGGLVMLAVSWLRSDSLWVPLEFSFLAPLLYLSLAGSVIAFAAYLTLIGRIGAGRASYNGVLIPIMALLLSTLFEGYRWQTASVAGVLVSLAGNILVMQGSGKPRDAPS